MATATATATATTSATPEADHAVKCVLWLAEKYGWFITGSFVREHVSAYLNDPIVPYDVALNNVIVNGSWPYKRYIAKGNMIKVIMTIADLTCLVELKRDMGLKVITTKEHKTVSPDADISYNDFGIETADGSFTLRVHWKDITWDESRFGYGYAYRPDTRKPVRLEDFESILEFECDNLVILPSGKVKTIIPNNTIRNVLEQSKKKMTVLRRNDPQQTSKLVDLGWTVIDRRVTYIQRNPLTDRSPPETCVICLDECTHTHIKRSCCNARYHCKCYGKVLNTSTQCPMCRSLLHGV